MGFKMRVLTAAAAVLACWQTADAFGTAPIAPHAVRATFRAPVATCRTPTLSGIRTARPSLQVEKEMRTYR